MLLISALLEAVCFPSMMCYQGTSQFTMLTFDGRWPFYRSNVDAFFEASYLKISLHLAGTAIGYLLAYCNRDLSRQAWLVKTPLRRTILVMVELLTATMIVWTAIKAENCP